MGIRRKIAVIGCGAIAPIHLQAIRELDLAEELHVCDIDPEAAAAVGRFEPTAVHADWLRMLDEVRPNAVHVCTPHDLHVPMTEACVDRGIPVLSEKPAGVSAEDCRPLAEKIRRTGAVAGICFQNRFNSFVLEADELIASGRAGRLLGGTAQVWWDRTGGYYSESPWRGSLKREGVGVLCNQSIHTLDLVRRYFGEPEKIRSLTANWTHEGLVDGPDTVMAHLSFPGGATVVFSATNACAYNQPVRIDLVCERATLTLEDGMTVRWRDGAVDSRPAVTLHGEKAYWGSGHLSMIRAFYESVDAGTPVPASWDDGLRMMEWIGRIAP